MEVQVRLVTVAGVADEPQYLSAADLVTGFHPQAPALEVSVVCEPPPIEVDDDNAGI